MKVLRLTLSAALLAPGAAATAAEAGPSPSPEALIKLHDYAGCLTMKRPKVVRDALAMDFRGDDYQRAIRAVSGGNNGCIPHGKLKFAPILVAGGMAEQAYKSDFGLHASRRVVPADWTARPISSRSSSEYAALCIVQHEPAAVEVLLGAKPASDAEKAAFQPLIAALPGCMQAETKLAFNRPFYRAILSLALYRAARHFSAPAAAMKN